MPIQYRSRSRPRIVKGITLPKIEVDTFTNPAKLGHYNRQLQETLDNQFSKSAGGINALGQMFRDINTEIVYRYDSNREKWLSLETIWLGGGSNLTYSSFPSRLQGFGMVGFTLGLGYRLPFDSTIVFVSANGNVTSGSINGTVIVNDVSVAETAFDSHSVVTNVDTAASNIVGFGLSGGPGSIDNPCVWVGLKWRSSGPPS